MPDEQRSLEARIDRIETRLDLLERVTLGLVNTARGGAAVAVVQATTSPPSMEPPPPTRARPAVAPAEPVPMPAGAPQDQMPDGIQRALAGKGAAYWLSRAGVGLLLLGVAFLFKYAVDQGWLTPQIRVVLGLALGLALAVLGLRLRHDRRWFGALALGAASATFYITGYAAFQLFHLVSYGSALAFLIAVTVYTLWAGWTTDEAALGVLGAVGGLATPFLLYADSGSVAGLAGYESAVLAAGAGIYLRKGWRSLLWTIVAGGWSVLAVALSALLVQTTVNVTDQWMLQLAILIAVLAFWGVPVLREQLATAAPTRWPRPPLSTLERMFGEPAGSLEDRGPHTLALSTPLVAFYVTRAIWAPADEVAAIIAAGGAVVWGATWWHLRGRRTDALLASVHAVAAAVLVAITLQHVFEVHALLLTWMVESAALLWLARRTNDRWVRMSGHALGAVVAGWLALRLVENVPYASVTDALVIGLAAVGAYALEEREQRFYRLGILMAIALWVRRDLPSLLPGGDAIVLFAWSLLGATALRLGRQWSDATLDRLAHVLFAATALWMGVRLVGGDAPRVAVLNLPAVLHVTTLGVAFLTARGLSDRKLRDAYAGAIHVLVLGWFWHELSRLPAGHAWVTVSWGLYGVALLVTGLRLDQPGLRKVALATFAAVVGKLFIVDLARLEPIWRILLFLGFGGAFMALSYYFPSLWKVKRGVAAQEAS